MTQYWCVNFDSKECMDHGIKHNFWMMQYQYEDESGNVFQGGRQMRATTANWNRLTQVKEGDWFVAYLPKNRTSSGNTFFAFGRVCKPRKPVTSDSHVSTVAEYVTARSSHVFDSGIIHYTDAPVFYEDFDDEWRRPEAQGDMRYAQRIDVEKWQYYQANGIPWLKNLEKRPNLITKAFFGIKKAPFDKIVKGLKTSGGNNGKASNKSPEIANETVVKALEKSYARSQGFMLDSKLRKALEDYSMKKAERHFKSRGYSVSDDSKNQPYDLKCVREDETLYVEVKGTQTDGEGIILTSGEVEFNRRNSKHMVLYVLKSIQVSKDHKKLSKGVPVVIHPWVVEEKALNPLSYKYEVPNEYKV